MDEERPRPVWEELSRLEESTCRLESLLARGLPDTVADQARTFIKHSDDLMSECDAPWPGRGSRAHKTLCRAMRNAAWYNDMCCTSATHELALHSLCPDNKV